MKASEIFHKTAKGQSEVETRANALSVKERRVLILVNGENNAAQLKKLSLCENIVEILDTLLSGGFIAQDTTASPHAQFEPESPPAASAIDTDTTETTAYEVSAREFMCNTLLTFANRVRVSRLIEEINAVEDIDGLKEKIKPWYHAISETPGGMYQADDLRNEVQTMIANEEISGLR
ncbi:MAG: hypothetical protein OEU50_14385 [Gammaproteobacteria bacterium]|nr:hypothetical protein [Gammaproteobacteria bacterium]